MSSASQCTVCDKGTFCPVGSATPTDCAPGTFNAQTKQESCTACTAGKFQDGTGAMTCVDCPSGREQPNLGADKCNECQVINRLYQLCGTRTREHDQA